MHCLAILLSEFVWMIESTAQVIHGNYVCVYVYVGSDRLPDQELRGKRWRERERERERLES